MKIKHWQGYGTVNAKKVSSSANTLVVEVWGNHEWGLERNDMYDVFNWLVKRFDKSREDYREMLDMKIDDFYVEDGRVDVEHCRYTIRFRPKE